MARARVASTTALAEGTFTAARVGSTDVLVARVDGRLHAVAAHCTHYHAPLQDGLLLGGRHIVCPWHLSVFDLAGGALLEPPALDPLERYLVDVTGDDVFVTVPDDAGAPREAACAPADSRSDPRTFVLVGAGAASLMAALELRRGGFRGRIVMVGREDRPPYDRPNCSKDYLAGTAPLEWLPLRSPKILASYTIERLTAEVVRVEAVARRVVLADGGAVSGDALLLATGSEPRALEVPGADLPGVFRLRSWDDADRIMAAAQGARAAVVVGAGFVGMEVAGALRQRGLDVTVVAPDRVPFAATLGEEVGEFVRRRHEDAGVRFRLGPWVERLEGADRVREVKLAGGERLAADLVVVGIGGRPATAIIADLPVREDGSLKADATLAVTDGVWAAGDIASWPDPRTGERLRSEHWRVALQQGRAAARNMLAPGSTRFDAVPFFWTVQAGATLGYVGHAPRFDEVVVDGDLDALDAVACYVSGDRTVAALTVGRDRTLAAIHELLRAGAMPRAGEVREGDVDWEARAAALRR